MLRRFSLVIVALAVFPPLAFAHPGHGDGFGFSGGFAHPLLAFDHLLAMIAIGVWAGIRGGRATWMLFAIFVASMIGGFGVALSGVSVPVVDSVIVAIVTLGILIAASKRLPVVASGCVVGLCAMYHGLAHEAGLSSAALTFALGFVAAAFFLYGTGIWMGRRLVGYKHAMLARRVGEAVSGIGLLLLGGWL